MKNNKQDTFNNLNHILFIELNHSQKLLLNILNLKALYEKEIEIYIVKNDFLNQEAHDSKNIHLVEKNSQKHRFLLKKAHYIIVDSYFSENIQINKKQKLIHIPTMNHQQKLHIMQKICRQATYNVFLSKIDSQLYFDEIGMKEELLSNNIFLDYYLDSQKIIDLLYTNSCGKKQEYEGKKNILIYVGKINNKHQESLILKYINQLNFIKDNYFVLSSDSQLFDFIKSIHKELGFITYTKGKYSFQEKLLLKLCLRYKFIDQLLKNKTDQILKRNLLLNLNGLQIDEFIDLLDENQLTCRELSFLKCNKKYLDIEPYYVGLKTNYRWYKNNILFKMKNYDSSFKMPDIVFNESEKENFYNTSVCFYRCFSRIKKTNQSLHINIYVKVKSTYSFKLNQCNVMVGEQYTNYKIKKGLFFDKIDISLPYDYVLSLPAQNKIFIKYVDQEGFGFIKDIKYYHRNKNKYLKSKIINIDGKTSCYLRQSLKNRVYFTIRPHNRTDNCIENCKINFAYYLSMLINKKRIYILYEKDSSRYEESASVLYEKLIDEGYSNAYFILDKYYPDYDKIKEKYKKNIIDKYSFKHYLYFFLSETFFGSELLVHAMELRIMNKHVLKKINSTDINYIFLQHGVMYMISLDSDSRKYFTPRKDGKGKFRVVTSSQKEADHFVQLGGYNPEQVIICGLPKYDRNILYSNADKIVIMPTWRPWEYNQATTDFRKTHYYQMLERIVEGIGKNNRKHLIILPHPLFYKAAKENDFYLKKFMKFNVKYDEILRQTRVLITDYSSIAYDAFYRGSRVIFYWEELEENLENYGFNTKLMLNFNNVFGDICYNSEDLSQVIDENYYHDQKENYINNYNQIVEFHDSKNTERLIEILKVDGIL